MTWPLAFLISICAGLFLVVSAVTRIRLAIIDADMKREAANTKFLSEQARREDAAARGGPGRLQDMLESFADHHASDCSYCSCGASKLRDAVKSNRDREQKLRNLIIEQLEEEGWVRP